MRRREFISSLGGAAPWSVPARAQQPALPVIGFLHSRGADYSARLTAAFRRGSCDGGFIDGQNAMIEYRRASGRFDRLPALANKLRMEHLSVLLCLMSLSFVDAGAIAQEAVGQVLTLEQEKALVAKPGSDFKECANACPVMIVIPAGKFMMGSPEDEPDRNASEGPPHEVTIAKPFAVSKFEVTFEEWDACAASAACPRAPDSWGRGAMPVINVSWRDAKQYVGWLSQLTGKQYRLPTEAEWEYAARAGSSTRYSWGDDPGKGNAVCDACGSQWDLKQTAPIGSFKANAFGLYDMHGNVWEWVEDSWHETYDGAPIDGSAWLRNADPSFGVARGGAWRNELEFVRVAVRVKRHINVRFDTLGFRVARTIEP